MPLYTLVWPRLRVQSSPRRRRHTMRNLWSTIPLLNRYLHSYIHAQKSSNKVELRLLLPLHSPTCTVLVCSEWLWCTSVQYLRHQRVDPEFWSSLMCDLGLMYNTLARHLLDRPPLSKLTPTEVRCSLTTSVVGLNYSAQLGKYTTETRRGG